MNEKAGLLAAALIRAGYPEDAVNKNMREAAKGVRQLPKPMSKNEMVAAGVAQLTAAGSKAIARFKEMMGGLNIGSATQYYLAIIAIAALPRTQTSAKVLNGLAAAAPAPSPAPAQVVASASSADSVPAASAAADDQPVVQQEQKQEPSDPDDDGYYVVGNDASAGPTAPARSGCSMM